MIFMYPVNSANPFGHAWNFSHPWNSVNNIAFTIDVAIFVIGLSTGLVGATGSIKEILRRNAKGLVVKSTRQALLKARLSAASWFVGQIVGTLNLFLNLTIGMAIAKIWDRFDIHKNNGILDKLQ